MLGSFQASRDNARRAARAFANDSQLPEASISFDVVRTQREAFARVEVPVSSCVRAFGGASLSDCLATAIVARTRARATQCEPNGGAAVFTRCANLSHRRFSCSVRAARKVRVVAWLVRARR